MPIPPSTNIAKKDWLQIRRKGAQTAGSPTYCRSVRQCRFSDNRPFLFSVNKHHAAGRCAKTQKCMKGGGQGLGLGVNWGRSLEMQGQTYTYKLDICCHKPIGFQMFNKKDTLGEGDHDA